MNLRCIAIFAFFHIATAGDRRRKGGGREKVVYKPRAQVQSVRATVVSAPRVKQVQQQVQQFQQNTRTIVSGCEQRDTQHRELITTHNKLIDEYNRLRADYTKLFDYEKELISKLNDPDLSSVARFVNNKLEEAGRHPGISGAHNKTLKYIKPLADETLHRMQLMSVTFANETDANLQSFLLDQVGGTALEPYIPAVSAFMVAMCIAVPLVVAAAFCLYNICQFDQLLLSAYFSFAFAGMLVTYYGVKSNDDPLAAFAEMDYTTYQYLQVCFACGHVLYTMMVCTVMAGSAELGCVGRLFELLICIWIGISYYFLVWTPAMLDEMPRVNAWVKDMFKDRVTNVDSSWVALCPYYGIALYFGILGAIALMTGNEEDENGNKVAPKSSDVEGGKAD